VDAGVKRVAASSVEKIIHGSPADAERASEQLRPVRFAVDCDDLVRAYADENDQIKKDQIARAYKKVTGEEIYPRLAILLD
jgi:hypothetical protein